jgi:plasmid stabilization system protein ParE
VIFNVILSTRAVDTFDAIRDQIENRWTGKEAIEFEKRTLKVLGMIGKFPFMFEAIKGTTKVRRAFIHKNCSMFYEVKEPRVEVLFFWDNRQDPIL